MYKEAGIEAALGVFKVAGAPADLIKSVLHGTYGLGESGLDAVKALLAAHKARTGDLAAKGVGQVSRHLSSIPSSLSAGAHAFGRQGLGNAAVVGAAGLGAYGAQQAYKNYVEPNLPGDTGPAMYPQPYGGMF